MKIAICDDINENRASVKEYTEEYFAERQLPLETEEFSCGEELLNSSEAFDIAFLDIELGDANGIDVAKRLQKINRNIVIIIVTSHLKYLDDAMDIHAVRFINKPVTKEKVFSSLKRAVEELNEKLITVHLKHNQVLRVLASDVVYIESKFKKVIINTKERSYETTDTLKTVASLFNVDYFAVPHSSFIVNLNYIKDFKRGEILLTEPYDNLRISVASRKQTEFRRRFLNFIGDGIND